MRINSPGGDVFAAKAMQTAIMQHDSKIIAHIDGLAASAASVIAMGADEIEMVDGGFLMIHKALSLFDVFGYFNDDNLKDLSSEISKERKLLAKVDDSIAADYAKRSGKAPDEIKSKMADETWFDADEALEYNLINRIYEGEAIENKYDLSIYGKAPERLQAQIDEPTKREMEKALRDVGCSHKKAKAMVAGNHEPEVQREVEPVVELQPQRDAEPTEPTPQKGKVELLLERAAQLAG